MYYVVYVLNTVRTDYSSGTTLNERFEGDFVATRSND